MKKNINNMIYQEIAVQSYNSEQKIKMDEKVKTTSRWQNWETQQGLRDILFFLLIIFKINKSKNLK